MPARRFAALAVVGAGSFVLGGVLAPADDPAPAQRQPPAATTSTAGEEGPSKFDPYSPPPCGVEGQPACRPLSSGYLNSGCFEDEAAIMSPDGYLCLPVDDLTSEQLADAELAEGR